MYEVHARKLLCEVRQVAQLWSIALNFCLFAGSRPRHSQTTIFAANCSLVQQALVESGRGRPSLYC